MLIARTDALSAKLLTSDHDPRDRAFLTGERTAEGFFHVRDGLEPVIERSLAYAPYADVLWFETSTPDLDEARAFAEAIHAEFPGKLLAYNCSPSFNWRKHLDDDADRARSSRSSARWATSSSSSRSPASTRSTSRCSSSRAATRRTG